MIRGGILKEFSLALVAADPRIYGDTETTTDSGPLSGGTVSVTVTNAGSAGTPPRVRVYGQITNPAVTVGGRTVGLTYTVAAGTYVEIDMRQETVKLGDGSDLSRYLNVTASDFWELAPGSNTVTLTGTGPNGAEKVQTIHRSAWA